MPNAILVINAGSSSIKSSLFAYQTDAETLPMIYHGAVTGIGTAAHFEVKDAQHHCLVQQPLTTADHDSALAILLNWFDQQDKTLRLTAVGHRVVHGGVLFKAPVIIDASVLEQLEQLIPLAPLHQPHNLTPIKWLQQQKPHLPQIACFDTAFHATQPATAQLFALPRILTETGIKRYGFHGLSYEYIARVLPNFMEPLPERVIVAHLGNGASMAALKQGRSIATTMSFTPLDGLPMGTRCGAIDAGVILHLLNQGMDLDTLTHLLYHRAGLLGISDISSDMQTLLQSDSPQASEAIELFVYRLGRELGSLVAALGGLDALVFTAGIGENSHLIRTKICANAQWLRIKLNQPANQQHQSLISTPDSLISVWVIPTDEEKMIAQHTHAMLKTGCEPK